MSLEDKWASLDKKLDGILRNQSYIIQKVLLMQSQLEQLSTAAPAKGAVPKPKEENGLLMIVVFLSDVMPSETGNR